MWLLFGQIFVSCTSIKEDDDDNLSVDDYVLGLNLV